MAYLKPQSPLKNNDDYIHPLTTVDQIIMEDGSRLSNNISSLNIISKTTVADNGKFLRVIDGSHIQNVEEVKF